MDVTIVPCTTMREHDGLAMSSRNMRLSKEQRARAICLNQYLQLAKSLLGTMNHSDIEKHIQITSEKDQLIVLEYLNIVDKTSLNPCTNPLQTKGIAICIAAFVDEIRLIDNIIVSS